MIEKNDRKGYNIFYKGKVSSLSKCGGIEQYLERFRIKELSPFYMGGGTKSGVRGQTTQCLFSRINEMGLKPEDTTISCAWSWIIVATPSILQKLITKYSLSNETLAPA